MTVGSRFYSTEAAARAHARTGERILVIGNTWLTAPHGVTEAQARHDLAELIRTPSGAPADAADTSGVDE